MTVLKQPEPQTAPSIQGAFSVGDYHLIYMMMNGGAVMANGRLMLVGKNKYGTPDWKGASLENLKPVKREPSDMETASRLCILVDNVHGCDTGSAFIFYVTNMHGEEFVCRQIAGNPEDKSIAYLLFHKAVGRVPRLVPLMPDADRESPAPKAANDNEPTVPLPAMDPEPFATASSDGLIADVSCWITSTAIVPVPELSLMSAIALLAGVFGKYALGPTNSGINLYITTLLETAGGKGHPPKAARSLGDKCGALGAMSNGDPTSYAAIERMLRKHSSTVITMDEFGITLQDVNGKHQNSVAASIRKMLLAVYDQANSSFDGRIYASSETKKDDGPIVGPALTVLGMTTPATLYSGLSSASVADGFINRFLFVTSRRDEDGIRVPGLNVDTRPPDDLVERLQKAIAKFPKNPLGAKHRVPFKGGEDGEAYRRWGEIFLWQHHAAWDDTARNINGRAAENTVRLATIRAISRSPSSPELSVDDVEWGWAIVHRSIELIADGVARHMSASPAEALRKAIIECLRDAPDKTMPFSTMLRKKGIAGADLRELEGALMWLVQSGEITDVNSRPKPGAGSKFRCNS